MLDFNKSVFPANFIDEFAGRLSQLNRDLHVFKRRVTTDDPAVSAGIFGNEFRPVQSSKEIMGMFPHEPALSRYEVTVQGMIIETVEEVGLRKHYILADAIRSTLAYDEQIRLDLSLSVTDSTGKYVEELRKWSLGTQEYLAADLGRSKWGYMSVTSINLETETRRVA